MIKNNTLYDKLMEQKRVREEQRASFNNREPKLTTQDQAELNARALDWACFCARVTETTIPNRVQDAYLTGGTIYYTAYQGSTACYAGSYVKVEELLDDAENQKARAQVISSHLSNMRSSLKHVLNSAELYKKRVQNLEALAAEDEAVA